MYATIHAYDLLDVLHIRISVIGDSPTGEAFETVYSAAGEVPWPKDLSSARDLVAQIAEETLNIIYSDGATRS
jgi:hypothetical protein